MKSLIKKIVPACLIEAGLKLVTFVVKSHYSRVFKTLIVRKNTTDVFVFRSIFIFNEFKLPVELDAKFIIDAGAYTGLSGLYFSHKYPQAKIFTVEPDDFNFEMLRKNTESVPNITRIKSGVWDKEAFLEVVDPDKGSWGLMVKEVEGGKESGIKSTTIDALLEKSGFDRIDILKLDVEGSEKKIFSGDYQKWLSKVNVIIIELHDRLVDGCSDALYAAVDDGKWDKFEKEEKVILVRKELIKD